MFFECDNHSFTVKVLNCEVIFQKFIQIIMKTSIIKPILVILICFKCLKAQRDEKIVSYAFKNLIQTMAENNHDIQVTLCDVKKNLNDFPVIESLKTLTAPFKIKNQQESTIENSGFLMFESIESLNSFNNKTEITNKYSASLQFFVFCEGATVKEISELKETFVLSTMKYPKRSFLYQIGSILQFQYFIVNEEKFLKLMTFVWYKPENCGQPQLIEVNRFDKIIKKWEKSKFIIEKFENLNACRLIFGVPRDPPGLNFKYNETSKEIYGYNLKVLTGLARHLNYTMSLNPYFANNNTFIDNKLGADALVLMQKINSAFATEAFITRPYIFSDQYVTIPPGEAYDAYEKLLLPFDSYVWALTIFMFSMALISIVMIKFSGIEVQRFVFGRKVQTPTMNLFAHFFGISQCILPGRNFARFLLMIFVLFSLIWRTAYQAKMFEFLQSNLTKPEIQSIAEMIEKNFTFFMYKDSVTYYKDLDVFKGYVFLFQNSLWMLK